MDTINSLTFLNGKPQKCCGTDALRPAMSHLFFNNGFVYATDAHVLIKQDLKACHGMTDEIVEKLNGKMLHRENADALAACDLFEIHDDKIIGAKKNSKTKVLADLVADGQEGEYPNVEAVIPSMADASELAQYALDPKKLLQLQSASVALDKDAKVLRLTFFAPDRGALVHFHGFSESEQLGVIMPCILW